MYVYNTINCLSTKVLIIGVQITVGTPFHLSQPHHRQLNKWMPV